MMAVLRQRWLWLLLALVLIGLVIWFAGPYVAFADYAPLESTTARVIAIALVIVFWGLRAVLRELKAARAGNMLVKNVIRQEDPAAQRASVDTRQLQQRFTEAVEALQKSRASRTNLYELPWYIIIGPPGAGKTTAIVNSGLNFPLAQKFGKEALRGVGGTRNCDWWFTDQAILLDTAGRYTTQDSDQASDAAGWREFLALLRKYRKRRPINGVLVAISLAELATQTDTERARHVAAVRHRLDELHRELRILLPVYVVFTKCDLLAGFNEFFDDLSQEGREQVWGMTFPLDASRAGATTELFATEFARLLERLNARMLLRMEAERDLLRRANIFGFPRQLAGTQRTLAAFLGETFGSSAFEQSGWLRGVYFTSGTQVGTPIDRMLGALARTFGIGMKAINTQGVRGRAYFIRRLLSDVLFKESGLAGVNRRMETRQALVQAGVYLGLSVLTVLMLAWFAVSFARNHAYLADVQGATHALVGLKPATAQDIAGTLVRLDAYREVLDASEKYQQGGVPVLMRAGLYQGSSLASAAEDAYLRELNASLAPAMAAAVHDRLMQLASEPDKLYEYLKVYLMLANPERLAREDIQFISDLEWRRRFNSDAPLVERLDKHVTALVADKSRLEAVIPDNNLVEQARTSLRQASAPVLMYSSLKPGYLRDTAHAIYLDREIGLGGDSVFVRKSGVSLSDPIPALYTRWAFEEVAATGKYEAANDFVGDSWVLGEGVASKADVPRLAGELMRLYEDDYIRAWDNLLADLAPRPPRSARELADMMALLASPSSPLKRLLVVVEANTNLLKAPDPDNKMASVKAAIAEKLRRFEQTFGAVPAAEQPGARVTQHFQAIHKLIDGPAGAAPIEQTLAAIGRVQKRLAGMGGALGKTDVLAGVGSQDEASAMEDLRVVAMQLPAPVAGLVVQIGAKGEAAASAEAGRELTRRYQTEVIAPCRQLVAGRYPFAQGADLALADFATMFAPGGVFDTFFRTRLDPLVDTSTSPWRWKEGAGGIGSGVSLAQFQAAERIRQVYFPAGSSQPQVRFSLTPEYLDRGVERRAQRMMLEIDGQTIQYRYDSPRAQLLVWPGPTPGESSLLFEEGSGAGPSRSYQGPWAFFHLLDNGTVQSQPQSDVRYQVTFTAGTHNAGVTLEAASVRNPFAHNDLRDFHCGG
jgi:type VI secretion system protein ImpL